MERNKDKIDDLLSFNKTTKSESFFNCFDNMCKNAFESKVVKFADHNKPIIERECFDVYVEAAEWCFPQWWAHMSNLRNVQGNRTKYANKLVQSKKRQVLLQILALRRMRYPTSLVYWSLIQTIEYYGWGVRRTALDANNFWGNSCSSRTRDRCLLKLTDKLAERRIRFFSDLNAITFCIDSW